MRSRGAPEAVQARATAAADLARVIVGTAGHVDHGKTALIRALTGIDCDRWAEEKRRGITIDLGFAHLVEDGVQLGIVDVPGHRRFLDNALAGMGGIRVLLLVVAATEGVMPQTREHVAIASLLGLSAALVALTKVDLAEPELIDLARLDVEQLLAETPFAGAAIVPVSSVTGVGLDELKRRLLALGREQRIETDVEAPVRLPMDRAFHLPGRGVVVTGTLGSGVIRAGDTLEILRIGKRFRVRTVQVHGEDREFAFAGERTSLLLAGAELPQLSRGLQLLSSGAFELSRSVCSRLTVLADAPAPLRPRAECRLHLLAEETLARVSPLERPALEPGEQGLVELRLREPLPIVRGDRVILRRPTPAATLGGGEIVDPRWRRPRRAALTASLEQLCKGSEEALSVWIERAGPAGISAEDLAQHLGVVPARLLPCLQVLVRSGRARVFPERVGQPKRWVAETVFARLCETARGLVASHFERDRFSLGMSKAELLDRLLPGGPESSAELLLRKLVRARVLEIVDGCVSLPGRAVELSPLEEACLAELEARYEAAGLEPPTLLEIKASAPLPGEVVESLARLLVARGRGLRLSNQELVAASAVDGLRRALLASDFERVTVPEFKALFGLTRRWAVPLLELCDTLGITRKLGMDRLIVRT